VCVCVCRVVSCRVVRRVTLRMLVRRFFVACARVPVRDACGWRGCASRAFADASGSLRVGMWGADVGG
jgi:hypothetical protein